MHFIILCEIDGSINPCFAGTQNFYLFHHTAFVVVQHYLEIYKCRPGLRLLWYAIEWTHHKSSSFFCWWVEHVHVRLLHVTSVLGHFFCMPRIMRPQVCRSENQLSLILLFSNEVRQFSFPSRMAAVLIFTSTCCLQISYFLTFWGEDKTNSGWVFFWTFKFLGVNRFICNCVILSSCIRHATDR